MRLAEHQVVLPQFPDSASAQVVHELRVHQIELEMQNEALREAQCALEESRDRYADLYEFAPVGYLTLTKHAVIFEGNLTGAAILGVDRRKLIKSRFGIFVTDDDRDRWNQYFAGVLRTADKQVCELKLRKGDGSIISTRLESIRMKRVGTELVVRTAISDITDRVSAQESLAHKIRDLDELKAAYETIAAGQEELRQNEARLTEALEEKEALLSEVHHRVKNNLTAFISLLSLDGSYEDTEGGRALRKDLQNRARSMALIHETLYRTGKFSNVDMEIYLNNLISQIAGTYAESGKIRAVVDVHGVALDLDRATTAGLIINEVVTNSFKYAFPPGFDCMAERGEPCTIRVLLAHEDGMDVLRVADNGRGLPEGFDPMAAKSLGLRLVNFLARHQLRAETEVRADKGTEFVFRLKNTGDEA